MILSAALPAVGVVNVGRFRSWRVGAAAFVVSSGVLGDGGVWFAQALFTMRAACGGAGGCVKRDGGVVGDDVGSGDAMVMIESRSVVLYFSVAKSDC